MGKEAKQFGAVPGALELSADQGMQCLVIDDGERVVGQIRQRFATRRRYRDCLGRTLFPRAHLAIRGGPLRLVRRVHQLARQRREVQRHAFQRLADDPRKAVSLPGIGPERGEQPQLGLDQLLLRTRQDGGPGIDHRVRVQQPDGTFEHVLGQTHRRAGRRGQHGEIRVLAGDDLVRGRIGQAMHAQVPGDALR